MKKKLKNYLDFLWAMTEREIRLEYKGTIIGLLWALVNPLIQMLVIGLVFSYFIKIPNYFLFLIVGLIAWNFFSASLTKSTPSIVDQRFLLQKSKFPIEAIPLSIVLSNFIRFIFSLLVLVFVSHVILPTPAPFLLLILPASLWFLVFTLSVSLLTSCLHVRFRDVNFLVKAFLIICFYATPVVYSFALIPENIKMLFILNPLTSIFELFRLATIKYGLLEPQIFLVNLILTFLLLYLAILLFRKEKNKFVDYV